MKTIEIKTTQNVVLQYELAELKDRAFAFVLDLLCLIVLITMFSAIGAPVFATSEVGKTLFEIFLACIFIFYSLTFEVLNNGQSIGKMAMKIRVIKAEGDKATFADYAARWVFRMVDIYFSLGCVASVLVSSSARGQRIGDIVANTTVIKLVPKMDLNLRDLLAIKSKNSYQPQYMAAKQLTEGEALLIKSTLDRAGRFNNRAHREAMSLLAERIRQMLEIAEQPSDNRKFLLTVLNDYVVLTR